MCIEMREDFEGDIVHNHVCDADDCDEVIIDDCEDVACIKLDEQGEDEPEFCETHQNEPRDESEPIPDGEEERESSESS